MRCEGGGKPLVLVVTAGQRHESQAFEALMAGGQLPRRRPGRRRWRPRRLVGDRGYNVERIRSWCRRRGVRYTIPRFKKTRRRGPFDAGVYRTRNKVERLIGRLKQWRRVATRYEKRAANYLAMVTLAAIMLWVSV